MPNIDRPAGYVLELLHREAQCALGNGRNRTGVASASESEGFLPQKMHAPAEPVASVREFIRAHPLPVVLGALVLRFVGARWVRED